jgi:hypothetical protein
MFRPNRVGLTVVAGSDILNHVSGTISGVAAVYNRHAYLDEMHDAFTAYEAHLAEVIGKYSETKSTAKIRKAATSRGVC